MPCTARRSADRSCDKADLVAAALQAAGGDTRRAIMIGDRSEDVIAARANEVAAVAVGWGYGSGEELLAARPAYLANCVADLVQWVDAAAGSDWRTCTGRLPIEH